MSAPTTTDHRFHLVISTIRSPEHIERCLESIRRARVPVFVTVVEQRPEPDALPLLQDLIDAGHAEHVHEPVVRGVSRGRNRGLAVIRGDIVAFPDDDCWFDDGVLELLSDRMETEHLDGAAIPCRAGDDSGTMLRWRCRAGRVTSWRVPRTIVAAGIFLRRELLEQHGLFDVALGTGAATPFGSGEENDLVIRALRNGASIRYMPDTTVRHGDFRHDGMTDETLAKVLRYNRGFGRVLRKHRLRGQAGYWILRSVAAVVVAGARRDRDGVRFQRAQLRGRWQGWHGTDDHGVRHLFDPTTTPSA
jgi:GT2 family glycosyltransferase